MGTAGPLALASPASLPLCPSPLPLQETEPMGTAGPLALARALLDDGSGKPFFVLNR